jgi:TolB-like protein/Flp pilus assembly protein TadD
MQWASFWRELKQRKLVQWGLGYLAASLVLVQLADFLSDTFTWQPAVLRVMTVLLGFAFLAVLVFAWYHGERGHQTVRPSELLILALIAIAAGLTSWRLAQPPAQAADVAATDPVGDVTPVQFIDDGRKSVAVRPFSNIGDDPANEYFSDGITEDIIARLSQVGGLRVISRTSVMQYKKTDKTIRQIGQELGVEYVLEGSVQRSNDDVRIIAQLIDANTDEHVWSGIFDRKIQDILAVQGEVAQQIATELSAELTPNVLADLRQSPKVDPEAYTLYLKGLDIAKSDAPAERAKALEFFDSAIAKDSTFVPAYAAIAETMVPPSMGLSDVPNPPENPAFVHKRIWIEQRGKRPEFRTIEMDSAAHAGDFERAERAAREAIDANPNYARAHQRYGMILARTGRHEEGLSELNRARRLDPRSPAVNGDLGELLYAVGRFDDAIEQLQRTVALDSSSAMAHANLGLAYHAKGRQQEAIAELQRAQILAGWNTALRSMIDGHLGFVHAAAGQTEEARTILEDLRDNERLPAASLAIILTGLGETEEAIQMLEKAVADRSMMLVRPNVTRALESLQSDPRVGALLKMVRPPGRPGGGRSGPPQPPATPDSASRTRRR